MRIISRFIILCLVLSLALITIIAQEDDDNYTVKIGESLREIALNLTVDFDCLMFSNAITNPSFITPGDVLIVPAECSLDATASSADDEVVTIETPPDEEIEGEIYIVSANQTLTDIAFELLVDLNCLIETNNIDNISNISEGDELIIAQVCLLIGGADLEEDTTNTDDEETEPTQSESEEAVPLGETTVDDDNNTDEDTTALDTTTDTTNDNDAETEDVAIASDEDDETESDESTDEALGQGGGTVETDDTVSIPVGEYVVRYGDTLARIANNANTTVSCLISTNRNITNADLIYAGQIITINTACVDDGQGGGGIVSDAPDDDRVCRGDRNPGRTTTNGRYVVQVGDMLDFIGCDFGLQTACLAEVNNLNPPGAIEIGQALIIDFSCPAWDGPPGPGDLGN